MISKRFLNYRLFFTSVAVVTHLFVMSTLVLATGSVTAAKPRVCSSTAEALFTACNSSVNSDRFVKKAICLNISDKTARSKCFDERDQNTKDGIKECREQRHWRLDTCKLLGEGRYDPNFDPANFDKDFTNLTKPNPYFPLTIGNHWEYRGGNETNTLDVLDQTKSVEGVTAIVVRDQVFKDGDLAENTDDWYAQALDGNTWYCGEEVKNYESFAGDSPRLPELVSIGGSFKAGRNGDKPGIIFLASPHAGDVYTEEFSLGNAEDVTVVLSTTYAYGNDPELDALVPQALADRFCSGGDCVVTKNFSLLEPGIFARKYYARGIGVFLEVEVDTQQVIQLVNCNFDPRCQNLPIP